MNSISRMSSNGGKSTSLRAMGALCMAVIVAVTLSACGAPLTRSSTGIEESTQLVIVSESLMGTEVIINGQSSGLIDRSDLERYRYGIMGSKDKREESLDRILLDVEPGDNEIRVVKEGRTIYERSMHFLQGQTREVEI